MPARPAKRALHSFPARGSALPASELQDSKHFREIADTLPVVLALASADLTKFLFVNRAYETIWGRTVQSLYANSLSFVEPIHPEDQPRLREGLAGLIAGRPIDGLECRLMQPDRSIRWVWCRGFPVLDAQGRIVHLVGTAQDISEMKRAEMSLRESEDRYRDLVEHSNDLICTHDLAGNILSVNETPLKILGYSREEMLQKPLRDFVAKEAKPLCDLYLEEIAKKGVATGLLPVLTKRGEVRLWEYHNSVRQAGVRSPIVRGVAHDVTEQKRAEAALRKSEEKFSKAFRASPVEMFISTLESGRLLDVNESFEKSPGVSRDQLIGRTKLELGIWQSAEQRAAVVEEIKANGRIRKREMQVRMPSGETVFRLFSAEMIWLNGIQCLLVVSEDITERKRAEEAVRHLTSKLLRLHDEERRNIARDLHDSTGQDLAGLSTLLMQTRDDIPRSNRKARKAIAKALAVTELCIREVRTLSYVLHPPMLEETGLKDALSHYIKEYQKRTGIDVSVEISPDFGRLNREVELALFRVAQESLTNIHRHSGSEKARIRLEHNSDTVCLEVRDWGGGIPALQSNQGAQDLLASGVGLSSMAERLTQAGGRLEVDSDSSGTTVRGIVPLV